MFFTVEKFEKRAEELAQRRYCEMKPITPLAAMDGGLGPDEVYRTVPGRVDGPPLDIGDTFDGRDRYLWVQKRVALPAAREGCEVAGRFDFGSTGGGGNSGFEGLLYLDGRPYQGVDTNHTDVILTPCAGQEVTLTFLLWTGLEGGGEQRCQRHRVASAEIGYLNKAASELYYLTRCAAETLRLLPENMPERATIIGAVEGALKIIDWDDERFFVTVGVALAFLRGALEQQPKLSPITVHAVGHTHIDVAWLWRLKHTREKAMRSFSTVLRLMDEYEEYVFLQTQPQLYQYLKSDCPELYAQIKERIREGRWEADGGMWLEADCNISSGEALVRQFLHGITFLRDELGVRSEYLWLPDVFGYSWALPQILRQCGLKTFMTTKISWNQFNAIPNDLFIWRGIDGSEILTYFVDTPDVVQDWGTRYATYNGSLTPHTVLGSWDRFKNKNLSHDVLISYGYGDGGGGVNREMLEMRRAMDMLPGVPNVTMDRAASFFDKIHESVADTGEYVPVWDGELYLEYHRGTYTSQAYNKRMNRRMEFKLAESEWLSCAAMLGGGDYDSGTLHGCWETVLRNQFHDIIPGSSIHEVYEDSRKEYVEADSSLEGVRAAALRTLLRPREGAWTLGQPGSFARGGLTAIPEPRDGRFLAGDGSELPAQKSGGGWLVWARMDALSLTGVSFEPGKAPEPVSPFTIDLDSRVIHTPFYTARWDETGALCGLTDKENAREVLRSRGNVLEIFEDRPMNYDAWDIDIYYTQKCVTVPMTGAPQVVEDGALRAVLRFTYHWRKSVIEQDMIFYARSRRIDFDTRVDWHEDHRLLKAAFALDVRSTKATYDIQFGHVERPTHWNTSWDWARFEVCGHKWADLSETGYGVSLLNDCKYGYSVYGNVMKLSLLKSAKSPDPTADMGEHRFTYALYPHAGDVAGGGTIEEATALNLPSWAAAGEPTDSRQLVRVNGGSVCVDAVKKAEAGDCVILRFHECRGGSGVAEIGSGFALKAFAPCNLLEEEIAPRTEGESIRCAVKPFEIKTFKLWF